jgi:hypothetical protein
VTFEATPQDTYDQIIGSGAFTYPWYITFHQTGIDIDGEVIITGWSVDIEVEDPDNDDKTIVFTVSHQSIVDALDVIAYSKTPPDEVSDSLIIEAHALLYDPDNADFDAALADEVLQVMAFGGVVFG